MTDVQLDAVSKVFPGGIVAVDGLSLTIAPGEWLLLLGPSGCGKTTVLRLVAGLETPTSGTLRLGGRDSRKLAPHQRGVALVRQEPALYPHRTVAENLRFGLATPDPARERRVVEGLELGPLLGAYPGRLSGGQRQRVALARALVRPAGLLLLDEPLGQLDAPARAEICERMPLLRGQPAATIIHVTHDRDEGIRLADRVALLERGRLQQAGAVGEVLRRPRTRSVAAFLGLAAPGFRRGHLESGDSGLWLRTGDTSQAVPPGLQALWADFVDRSLDVLPGDGEQPELDLERVHLFDAATGEALWHGNLPTGS